MGRTIRVYDRPIIPIDKTMQRYGSTRPIQEGVVRWGDSKLVVVSGPPVQFNVNTPQLVYLVRDRPTSYIINLNANFLENLWFFENGTTWTVTWAIQLGVGLALTTVVKSLATNNFTANQLGNTAIPLNARFTNLQTQLQLPAQQITIFGNVTGVPGNVTPKNVEVSAFVSPNVE